jgi:DNA-binding NtrC family response regulator
VSWVSFIPPKSRRLVLNATQKDELPVILIGEPGSGKGTLARWVHENGPRSGKLFHVLTRQKNWEDQILSANGGTLLFPEWETCDFGEREIIQKLLKHRTLQTRSNERGPTLTHMINSRIILPALRMDGTLAQIFELTTLKSIQITLPPLRERQEELLDIAHAILGELAHHHRKDHVSAFDVPAAAALGAYDWPGNLRELRNVLSFALIRCEGELILARDLPTLGDESVDFFASRDEFEKASLVESLRQAKGSLIETARSLRVSKEFLLQKMKIYRIESDAFASDEPVESN